MNKQKKTKLAKLIAKMSKVENPLEDTIEITTRQAEGKIFTRSYISQKMNCASCGEPLTGDDIIIKAKYGSGGGYPVYRYYHPDCFKEELRSLVEKSPHLKHYDPVCDLFL